MEWRGLSPAERGLGSSPESLSFLNRTTTRHSPMSDDLALEFEQRPTQGPNAWPMDETDRSLRAYVAGLPEDRLAAYDPSWSDEQVRLWDGNFRDDGELMLVCCERDVEPPEFRQVVEEFLAFRQERGRQGEPRS